jgi:hypothetical protein
MDSSDNPPANRRRAISGLRIALRPDNNSHNIMANRSTRPPSPARVVLNTLHAGRTPPEMPLFRSHRATVARGTGGTAPGRLRRSQTLSTLDNIHQDQENTGIAPPRYNATRERGGEISSILFRGLMLRRI